MREICLPREGRREPLLCALGLDREEMTLRLLAGEEGTLTDALQGGSPEGIILDRTAPLAESIPMGGEDWVSRALEPLALTLRSGRRDQSEREESARAFLQERLEGEEPLKSWTAFLLWNQYLLSREMRDRDAAEGSFRRWGETLLRPLLGEGAEPLSLTLWYPPKEGKGEWALSQWPGALLRYAVRRLGDWDCAPRRCKVCGRSFLASGPRAALCGPACRKAQAAKNKRAFDQRARENSYDLLYKNACQGWRNRLNRARREEGAPAGERRTLEAAFALFKQEALERKRQVKEGAAALEDYAAWLEEQEAARKEAYGNF